MSVTVCACHQQSLVLADPNGTKISVNALAREKPKSVQHQKSSIKKFAIALALNQKPVLVHRFGTTVSVSANAENQLDVHHFQHGVIPHALVNAT